MTAAEAVAEILRQIAGEVESHEDGHVADYIPQLALADPAVFGLAMASMDGEVGGAGDPRAPFTIQSISKPFVYALALADHGLDAVSRWVGAEPSGEAFNAISLEAGTGRPANPMINAGAIVVSGLVEADEILPFLSAFAGRALDVDEAAYASEAATGDRNRALAYLMRSAGALPGEPGPLLDSYFRQCSIRVTATDLAVMAATLANGGRNPVTGAEVVAEPVAVLVQAVMASCGMYDAAGDWLLRVGLPAKSGVSGGVIATSPGRCGVAAFSPRLDPTGASVRGVAAVRMLSDRFGLHLMHNPSVREEQRLGMRGTIPS
ncbi:glutaminase A [Phytomonospora sp. NPDC050363]|uniref:glutaminase A n=1 Tax=Phytomonospora sp. NPDC050363 TaxID=3155642 RepID=UPI0033FC93A6